ncbi:inactive peptidyl-prolyl cis-trans isomerase shutdown [Pieris rapae]|uniref:inactive peptidyl-prolyl cis-trans isomerase shutdown n=1 Tax=Pieris rapae TaxID=64459 RepID=UPI001E27FD01|nr:inactive peptidyl-prolyl cis-trans isomerase shutdown [Pieris rapae]XP_045489168.1 inactive peptidyl-prolyl cis-trans isomerase shutdown [Pieris rapae]
MESLDEPVQLSEGITISDLLKSPVEFSLNVNHKKLKNVEDDDDFDDIFESESSSDSEDIVQMLEESTTKMFLSCPEYHSFKDLATKMIDCVSSGDVKMLILEEGEGPLVPVDAEVSIHYAAYWEKAKIPFDSTITMNRGEPKVVRLSKDGIIPGLEIGLTAVKGPTARFLLLIQPALAWGPQGILPRIKPEPALFVVNLLSVNDIQASIRFNDLPLEEQRKYEVTIRTVTSLHTQAKNLYARKKFNKCIKHYQQSICVLNLSVAKNSEEEAEIRRLKVNTFINSAVCYYKTNKPNNIIKMCESIDYISDVDKHCKALFYLGRAYEMLGNMDNALKYYKKALNLEPKNREIGKALHNLDEYNKKSAVSEKAFCQNVFKVAPAKKVYDVDIDFQNTVRDMCQNLAATENFTKFELPNNFRSAELEFMKDLCSEFKDMFVQVDGEGKKKRIYVIKKGRV